MKLLHFIWPFWFTGHPQFFRNKGVTKGNGITYFHCVVCKKGLAMSGRFKVFPA